MNERIRELALQSGAVPLVGHSGLIISNLNVEKFAELIIKECAKCITTGTYSADPPYDRIIPILLDVLTNNMMQHFGVEE